MTVKVRAETDILQIACKACVIFRCMSTFNTHSTSHLYLQAYIHYLLAVSVWLDL